MAINDEARETTRPATAPHVNHRRVPRPRELAPLMRPKPFIWNSTDRRLLRAATVEDMRRIARRRSPRAVFDYTDGGAEGERSMHRARAALDQIEFRPRVLQDVSNVDTKAIILGREASMPLVFAPTGFTRMMHHDGELAVARAADVAKIPYALSTMGTSGIEQVASAAPQSERWFQLYLWKDRQASAGLIERAWDNGYSTLVLTVDTPVAGSRLRDTRNGMTIPPTLTPRTVLDGSIRPWWWVNFLTTTPLTFASLNSWNGTVEQLANKMFDPSAAETDVAWLRSQWPGKLVIKGIQSSDDAARVIGIGADGVVISNHGGRQLDRAPVPLEHIAEIRTRIGRSAELFVDGGFLSGADIAAAVCLGADAVLVGRAYLYGLMAGGERGVTRVAEILHAEFRRTMQLLGARDVGELTPDHVRLRNIG